MLAVAICWYDDPSIFRLLDSLPDFIPKIIVDGKFKFADFKNELSDNIMRERVMKYPNTVLIDAPNLLENEKRQIYFDNMTQFKYCLILDSDEYIIEADWEKFLANCVYIPNGIFGINFIVESLGGMVVYPRLFVNPSDWEYYHCHNIFKNRKTGEIAYSGHAAQKTISGITCRYNDDLREKKYSESVSDYQKKLIKYEQQQRLEHQI